MLFDILRFFKSLSIAGLSVTLIACGTGDNNIGRALDQANQEPVIGMPSVTLIGGSEIALREGESYTEYGARASDNEDGDLTANILISGNVDSDTAGTYLLYYSVMDSDNNLAQAERRIEVINTDAPEITLNGAAEIRVPLGNQYHEKGAVAYDNQDGDLTDMIYTGGDTIDVNTVGIYTVFYLIEDGDKNRARVNRTVVVYDGSNPVIELLGGGADDGKITLYQGETYIEHGALASDVDANGNLTEDLTDQIVIDRGELNTSVVGSYLVHYSVADDDGNFTRLSRAVEVLNSQGPVINVKGESAMRIRQGGSYTEAGATAIDEHDGVIETIVIGGDSVDTEKVGTYVVSYSAEDSDGNTAIAYRTVVVYDSTAPVITLLGD
jgi:hypothetical protein